MDSSESDIPRMEKVRINFQHKNVKLTIQISYKNKFVREFTFSINFRSSTAPHLLLRPPYYIYSINMKIEEQEQEQADKSSLKI